MIEEQKEIKLTRCFIALDLPREIIKQIEETQEILKKKNLFYGKLTESETLHVTLKFLGEISDEKLREVKKKLEKIKFEPFEASLGELGVFSKQYVRMIWIRIYGKGLFDLQKKIDEALAGAGFKIEDRFMGHLTIARVKKVPDKKILLDYLEKMKISKSKFTANEFFIKKSELKPEGPIYSNLEKYELTS